MRDQLLADRPGLAGGVGDDVEDAVGQPGLGEDLAPEQVPTNEDSSDGLATTVLPRARAAASGRTGSGRRSREDGPDHPDGWRRSPMAMAPGRSEGRIWPIGL